MNLQWVYLTINIKAASVQKMETKTSPIPPWLCLSIATTVSTARCYTMLSTFSTFSTFPTFPTNATSLPTLGLWPLSILDLHSTTQQLGILLHFIQPPDLALTSRDRQVAGRLGSAFDARKKPRVDCYNYRSGKCSPTFKRRAKPVDKSTNARRWCTFLHSRSSRSQKPSVTLLKNDKYQLRSR